MKALSYSNKIVLYVEYENYVDKENYKLYLNGRYIARFSNAHYVIDNLEYDKEYLVEIKQEDKITFSPSISPVPYKPLNFDLFTLILCFSASSSCSIVSFSAVAH
mgnify:CR=1 FL=1